MTDLNCYTIGDNVVSYTNQYFPCGSTNITGAKAQNCCYGEDFCMEDGICKYTHGVVNGTGFYMGACTDPTWQDPACRRQCTSQYGQDIVYDTVSNEWRCCNVTSTEKNCRSPTDFTVNAPGPAKLETILQVNTAAPTPSTVSVVTTIPSLGATFSSHSTSSSSRQRPLSSSSSSVPVSSSSATSRVPTSSSSISPSQKDSSSSSGLSGGADAGIAVGVIVGVLLLAGLAFFLWRRRRRQNQPSSTSEDRHIDDATKSPTLDQSQGMTKDTAAPAAVAPYYGETPSKFQPAAPDDQKEVVNHGWQFSGYPSDETKVHELQSGYEDQYLATQLQPPQELGGHERAHELPANDENRFSR